MAYAHPRLGYHHTQAESKHTAYFDEDDSAVLDPAILDSDIMQSPHDAQFRKDSFANSNGVLSPAESYTLDQHYHGGLPVEAASAGPAHLYHDENNGFVRQAGHPQPHPSAYAHPPQGAQWAVEHGSGHCTPATGVDFMPPPPAFEAPQYIQQRADGAHGSFSHPPPPPLPLAYHGAHEEPVHFAPQVQTPMSPHSHQDWMGMAQQEMESRPMPKRMRPNSPPPAMMTFTGRDGIRKKNGRIEIPQERNIQTIDELIDKTTDEDLLKELKQQKRLLRNREAALASRQRKKKHTEDLEHKEKGYATQINVLENTVNEFQIERQHREEERQMLRHRLAESHRHIESLQEEMRNLRIQHNEETSSLRRRLNILNDQLAMAEAAPAMSAAPSSTGFTDFTGEMGALNMGPHDWDELFPVEGLHNDNLDDFTFISRPDSIKQSPVLEKRPSSSTVMQSPSKKQLDNGSEQPFATGLLFLLLLCGAYVASKPSHGRPSDLPQMPPEVQAAAPTVLKDLLGEAGVSAHASNTMRHAHQLEREPQPSHMPHPGPRASDRLDQMHQRLTAPTRQQEIDEAFSLTTAQYAGITNMNYPVYEHTNSANPDNHARPRRLADALASLQHQQQRSNKAEVYTRSLLWDQIPTDVVKQFKEMVRDHEEIEARQNNKRSAKGLKAETR